MAEVEVQQNAAEKRTLEESSEGVKAVVMNVEGTAIPNDFLKNQLNTYVRENLKTYFENHWDKDECSADITALREQATQDKADSVEGVVEIPASSEEGEDDNKDALMEAVVNNILWQLDSQRQNSGLSQIQNHIWRDGFKTSKVQGKLYEDVLPSLKSLNDQEKKVYTFSSNSVDSQKLFFGYTEEGDLSEYLSGHFDTNTAGPVAEKETFAKIAEEVDAKAEEILYVTSVIDDARTAAAAGFQTTLVSRDDSEISEEDRKSINVVSSLNDLVEGEQPAKK